MRSRFLRLLAAAAILGAKPGAASAQKVDSQVIKNLASQKTSIENRIADLQSQVDDVFAEKSYCSAEERREAYNKIRALQREIAALRKEYSDFKAGFIRLASTPTAGPQFDAAGIHPDDRQFWTADDNALAKLRESALAKANRIEQAPYRDCSEEKSTTAGQPTAPSSSPMTPPEPPGTSQPPSTPPATGPTTPLGGGCTEKEATERRLRIQDEILRLEEELIPIDGTKPEGRARQLELRREIDRLAGFLSLPCPPLLPPLKPAIPSPKTSQTQPAQPQPAPKTAGGSTKTGSHAGAFPTGTQPLPGAKNAKQEFDAITYGLGGLAFAFAASGGCDYQQLQNYIAALEDFARRARALAAIAREGGEFSTVNATQVQQLAEHIQRHIDEAKQVGAVDCPAGVRFKMNPWDGKIIAIHNAERAAVGALPLHWDPVLAAHADSYAQQLARTGQLTHAPREGRGIERENLGQGRPGWSPEQIVRNEWTSEKRLFRAGFFPNVCEGDWSQCAHYSQLIWPQTTDIGCGYAIGSGFSWLVCRYSPGGNKDGKPVGYRDPSTYLGGPLTFNPTYSPVLKAMRPVNPDKLEFGDEAVAEWKYFEDARGRCSVAGMTMAIDKLKYYAQAAHEHSAEERMKGNQQASGSYDAMARQLDERVQDASLYRDACARDPYRYPERG